MMIGHKCVALKGKFMVFVACCIPTNSNSTSQLCMKYIGVNPLSHQFSHIVNYFPTAKCSAFGQLYALNKLAFFFVLSGKLILSRQLLGAIYIHIENRNGPWQRQWYNVSIDKMWYKSWYNMTYHTFHPMVGHNL